MYTEYLQTKHSHIKTKNNMGGGGLEKACFAYAWCLSVF